MAPSTIYQEFKKNQCQQLRISTLLNIPPTLVTKLRGKTKGTFAFAIAFTGEGKLKLGHSVVLRKTGKKNAFEMTMYWFLTDQSPPSEMASMAFFQDNMGEIFGEREVDVRAVFSFNRDQIISFFKPIELGEQSQILDEIVGFTGVKRDREGKFLYRLEIILNDKSIELNLSFKQTVRLEENMSIALLETSSKISNLAVKPREGHDTQ